MIGGNDRDVGPMVRGKILLRRRANPQKVTLPDGRTLYTRYQRVSSKNLRTNVTINR